MPAEAEFYQKYLEADGIVVRASAQVVDQALIVARDKINLMLSNIPDVRACLVVAGAEFHIIGRNEKTSDLPELRSYKESGYLDNDGTKTDIDARTRGVGGLCASCGEENLLQLACDRYPAGQDICTHEFAHTIMDYGLTDSARRQIKAGYSSALVKQLWRGSYAASNAKEYWAELSMWFFGGFGDRAGDAPTGSGREALRAYDHGGWQLLSQLYNTKDQAAA